MREGRERESRERKIRLRSILLIHVEGVISFAINNQLSVEQTGG